MVVPKRWCLALVLLAATLGACDKKPRPFTLVQIKWGHAVYVERCESCHKRGLVGGEHASPLIGDKFWANWEGQSARKLYGRIISTMPANDPGLVPSKDVIDVVGYILAQNGLAVGGQEILNPDELNPVSITRREPGA